MKILYMGTPDFAVKPLKALIDAGHEIVGVFTQPDRPKGRGMKMTFSPVKECALEHSIEVYQPETMKNGAVEGLLNELNPDLIAVVAYGKLLPGYVLRFPKYGCINVHGSLLPKYRGAGPIQWAVINGEEVTGVTTMYMGRELDAGNMLLKSELRIGEHDTAETVYETLSNMGASLLVETVDALYNGTVTPIPQDSTLATYAPMLTKEDGRIDWRKSAKQIYDLARGTYPWPGAFATIGEDIYKLFDISMTDETSASDAGTVLKSDKLGFYVVCGDGKVLLIKELQAPGKRRMAAADFFRGHELFTKFDT